MVPMPTDIPSSDFPLKEKRPPTFADIAASIYALGGGRCNIEPILATFQDLIVHQESLKTSRVQLSILRKMSAAILEAAMDSPKSSPDVPDVLSELNSHIRMVSKALEPLPLQPEEERQRLGNSIQVAFEALVQQLHGILGERALELSDPYRIEMLKALEEDGVKISDLKAIMKRQQGSSEMHIRQSMNENLKILTESTVQDQRVDAKKALAILAELKGTSLPPSTLLGREFVTVNEHSIHSGGISDIFLGQYFTGEEIAVKVFRHQVDGETARKTHKRYARQVLNWSPLRHDAVHPFYGFGVGDSPGTHDKVQLYMVSPYLQNQDARRYLKKYPTTSAKARLQMTLDIARGLHYIHKAAGLPEPGGSTIHGALNIFNILIKDSGRAVISGFGHSKVLQELTGSFKDSSISKSRYMAPEMMQEAPQAMCGTDIWGWAMTSLEILTDVPPFEENDRGASFTALLTKGERPRRSNHPQLEQYICADELWNLFTECWDHNPLARPSAETVVQCLKLMLEKESGDQRKPATRISSTMSIPEVISCLASHGCKDMTSTIDMASSIVPFAPSRGGFGDVYRGFLQDGHIIAIKCTRVFVQNKNQVLMLKNLAREIYAWSRLQHPHVTEVLGVGEFRNSLAIISPWMEHGSVTTYLSQHPNADRYKLCAQVSSGLSYMHLGGMVHGDLKGANILVSDDGVAHLTDFGNAVLRTYTLSFCNTDPAAGFGIRWAAPELLENKTGFSFESDVYALGMTILEIITGKLPFHDKSEYAAYLAISDRKLPTRPQDSIPTNSKYGDTLWKLIVDCCAPEPKERLLAREAEKIMGSLTQTGFAEHHVPKSSADYPLSHVSRFLKGYGTMRSLVAWKWQRQ